MACPRCGAETHAGQKFCAECGLALSQQCFNCSTPYEGSPKFCPECGVGLAASVVSPGPAVQTPGGPVAAAERRFVTVLFADLVGFTPMSEQHDPEEVRDLLSRYFEFARQVIEGYGGTVEKFIGDAVMAVWGAPVAHEDDAERAVRAGLELVDRVKQLSIGDVALTLRAGVVSGEAAVSTGRVGEGMIAGDIVNTASRLQSVAPPGVVLVGESTQRATSAAIAYEQAGEQLLKGKAAPVEAWRALRVVARVGGAGREEGLEPPFVGRDEELRLLKDQLHMAERERKLRVVSITGQAGMGKSRLAWELEKYLDGLAEVTYFWHQGRSPAYGEGVTFWALGEMVRRRAHIAEGEDEATTRGKLRATLADFAADDAERRALEPALGVLLGIDEADWASREQLFSLWRTFLERVADQGPSVFVFEDVQWADSGLLDFIDYMLEWTRDRPILVVTLARPEFLERRPDFGRGHRAFVSLHLEPLRDEAMEPLLLGLVPKLPAPDLQRIVERAEGVPLYAVETIRALVGGGHLVRRGDAYEPTGDLPALDTPATLRALIASRLDALAADDRGLLQNAAVLGLVFSPPAVAALEGRPQAEVEARLRILSSKELTSIETDPRSPERGQYRFMQGLIREVAYGTLSKRDRRARHLKAASYFETLGDDELAGVLANHYAEAYQAAPEGDEGAAIAAQARVALKAAAERAARLHSHQQAVAYLEQALAVTFDERDQVDIRLQAGRSALWIGSLDKSEEHYRAALDWFNEHGETTRAGETVGAMAEMLLSGSRIDDAMQLLRDALANLRPDERATIKLNNELARGHMFRGEFQAAYDAVSRALENAERAGLRGPAIQLLITKSWAMTGLDMMREATALLMGAMRLADDTGDLPAQTRARFNLVGYLATDDPRLGLQVALEGLALANQYGMTLAAANMAGNASGCALMIGDFARVHSLESASPGQTAPMSASVHGYAAVARSLIGDHQAAHEKLELVEALHAGTSSPQDLGQLDYMRAMIAFSEGRLADARQLARRARDVYLGGDTAMAAVAAAQSSILLGGAEGAHADRDWLIPHANSGLWVGRSLRTLDAALLALDGQPSESAAAFTAAIAEWRANDMPLDLALALYLRARLLGATDKDAAAGRDEAQQILAGLGADGLLERLESGAPAAADTSGSGKRAQRQAAASSPTR
ncbi:MAG: adenylate/guanylate cyclase domain-containing protein [Solirubrobacterales bacterium]